MRRIAAIACIVSGVWMALALLLLFWIQLNRLPCAFDDARWAECNGPQDFAVLCFCYGAVVLPFVPFVVQSILHNEYVVQQGKPHLRLTIIAAVSISVPVILFLVRTSSPFTPISSNLLGFLVLSPFGTFSLWSVLAHLQTRTSGLFPSRIVIPGLITGLLMVIFLMGVVTSFWEVLPFETVIAVPIWMLAFTLWSMQLGFWLLKLTKRTET